MKVKMQEGYKDFYTVADVERAKEVIKFEKECDDMSVKEAAEIAGCFAANHAGFGGCVRVVEASASTAKNARVYNLYSDTSGNMDVWVEALVKFVGGYAEIGAYLSDIWQSGAVDYYDEMYIKKYVG